MNKRYKGIAAGDNNLSFRCDSYNTATVGDMINIGGYNISLDRREQGTDIDFISHAHTDHIRAARSSKSLLTSDQTSMLIGAAYHIDDVERRRIPMPAGIRLINSGHMLGSKQLVVESDGEKLIYTGDFQLQKSKASPKIDIEQADTVIIDSTYPYTEVRFDERERSEDELKRWVGGRVNEGITIFGSYVMGKAQELIKILNEIGIAPVVSRDISNVSKVYEKSGLRLDYLSMYDDVNECEEAMTSNFVGITDNRSMKSISRKLSYIHGRRVFTAVATGFSKIFDMNTDAQFCISDHADITQSLEYISRTGARRVCTYGQNAERFAASLQAHGISATPIVI